MQDRNKIIRTYKVEIRPPLGQSYAREIAAHYGINYQQLELILSQRGVLKGIGDVDAVRVPPDLHQNYTINNKKSAGQWIFPPHIGDPTGFESVTN